MTEIAVLWGRGTFAPLAFWSKYEKFYYARWYTQWIHGTPNFIKEEEY